MQYDIHYQILNYQKYQKCLKEIMENPKNRFSVSCHEPIGYSACGFPIEHYSIGHGPYEIVYMGGAHGNEIIGVDFVLQFMKNLALGNGAFASFQPELFCIHFFPLQNPEGFFTTTYAIQESMRNQEEKDFCYQYYLDYRNTNLIITSLHALLKNYYQELNPSFSISFFQRAFWRSVAGKNITMADVKQFLEMFFPRLIDESSLFTAWQSYHLPDSISIPFAYQKPFTNLSCDCILEETPMHTRLRYNVKKIMTGFPNYMLGNFCANSLGVNLNENNEPYFMELKQMLAEEKTVFVPPIYGSFSKHIPGPFGAPSASLEQFSYASENVAVLNFLKEHQEHIYAFVNCHSTGGMLYFYPFSSPVEEVSDFSFYINNRLATEYLKGIEKSYQTYGVSDSYRGMGHPSRISGFGDVLRKKYPASFLLELSKAGGNPLGPYISPNYELTMAVNMDASMNLCHTILSLVHLYDKSYQKRYNKLGRVTYEEKIRRREI